MRIQQQFHRMESFGPSRPARRETAALDASPVAAGPVLEVGAVWEFVPFRPASNPQSAEWGDEECGCVTCGART